MLWKTVILGIACLFASVSPGDGEEDKKMNRLKDETSPYLLQHAGNPVDWYPWGAEAFEAARKEGRPVFLSIGYSTCHWCHVMAHESFEDKSIADILNANFVSIKVDREERPDIDDIYMKAVMEMNHGSGGWPLSVFLTPDKKPFFGGTYFPPDRFKTILVTIADRWKSDRKNIEASADEFSKLMGESLGSAKPAPGSLDRKVFDTAVEQVKYNFDADFGGFSYAPKFPTPTTMELLLYHHRLTGDKDALGMVVKTCEKMALGGIYDQIGGGFHRYSTDREWLIPHFEKMLYDNAQLISLYCAVYKVTADKLFLDIARETAAYLIREMRSSEGGYYSAKDADSEGIEGKFYCWDREELDRLLDNRQKEVFYQYFDVRKEPNFEIRHGGVNFQSNVLSLKKRIDAAHSEEMARLKQKLFEARKKRVHPSTDKKILTSWNALLITAFCELYKATGGAEYLSEAQGVYSFINKTMKREGLLYHSFADGSVRTCGVLEDYSYLAKSLFSLYEVTFSESYLDDARALIADMTKIFHDDKGGGFYDYDPANSDYIFKLKDIYDGVLPAPNAAAVDSLQRLAAVMYDDELDKKALSALRAFAPQLVKYPAAYVSMCVCLSEQVRGKGVVVIAAPEPSESKLAKFCYSRHLPDVTVVANAGGSKLPVCAGKAAGKGESAYLCQGKACLPPISSPEELEKLLGRGD